MEVQKLALLGLVILVGCSKEKSAETVFPQNTQQSAKCATSSQIKNEFVVRYEDGRIELVKSENSEVFVRDFLNPNLAAVQHVEFNSEIHLKGADNFNPSRATDNGSYGPEIMNAAYAWNQGIEGQNVMVAVVDAAVDYSHPQIKPRLAINPAEANGKAGVDDDGNGYVDDVYGWDFYGNRPEMPITLPDPNDKYDSPNVHGTHVAGIIAADPTTGDIKGIAPKAQIIPVNFMGPKGGGSMFTAVKAIQYAAARGAKVINASWGGNSCDEILKDAIASVGNQALFVTAAGNDSVDMDRNVDPYFDSYPAMFVLPNQITVAATDWLDEMASFSNRGYRYVHLAAPGVNIRSSIPYLFSKTGSAELSGTSMATPMVSGTAALMWSAKPNATVAQIKEALLKATEFKYLKVSTQGRLNVQKAVDEIRRIAP
jgi:subtilisin family serine protease